VTCHLVQSLVHGKDAEKIGYKNFFGSSCSYPICVSTFVFTERKKSFGCFFANINDFTPVFTLYVQVAWSLKWSCCSLARLLVV
jgi:hypothetical protein